jgi:hypothetical protein
MTETELIETEPTEIQPTEPAKALNEAGDTLPRPLAPGPERRRPAPSAGSARTSERTTRP